MNFIHKITLSLSLSLMFVGCAKESPKQPETPPKQTYGIVSEGYSLWHKKVKEGETMGKILSQYGISPARIDALDRLSDSIFPLSNIRAGHPYVAFVKSDSVEGNRLDYLVYEHTLCDYVVFGFKGDSVWADKRQKPVEVVRCKHTAKITSSLWGAIAEAGMPLQLADAVEDIYQWSFDFFGIQEDDEFTVIYDQRMVEGKSIGIGQIWGAKFVNNGKEYYAIPFKVDGKLHYWGKDGKSMKRHMLKAPLKYSRISSRFSNSRLHPVLKIRRPHRGVDYAAPSGTPVVSVADGVVVRKGWDSHGGGNMLKIKHAGGITTGYLHLRGFAKGIRQGMRVSQGQLIGYVGSTGRSTGPHLDYRVWRSGVAVDPLKLPELPSKPIPASSAKAFETVCRKVVAELDGEVKAEDKLLSLDPVEASDGTLNQQI